ncbi:MAG: hypothetical protein JST64_07965 [Actinobacteria bacterium]|nr:hypothetical protein [Actinomycetota bacterium]
MSFRDRFFTPRVARATTSPSAILAAGAGAAVGVLAFANPVGAVLLGAGAYVARVLAAVPGAPTRAGSDVRGLVDPWRSLMTSVLDARHRYDTAIGSIRPGPLRDRLVEVGGRMDTAVDDANRIARAGNTLTEGRKQIDLPAIRQELTTAQGRPRTESTEETVAAIEAQIASAERMDATIADTHDRLRLLDARLDEMVARTVELAATQASTGDLGGLGSEVDDIVAEMESLRQAVEETHDHGIGDIDGPAVPGVQP